MDRDKDIARIRRQILDNFLQNLDRISDKDYQKRVWIEGRGPEVHDFDEAVCDFFDLGESIFDNYQGYEINETQYQLLLNFRKKFENFSNENDWPEKFIDTPEWAKIIDMAKEILQAFNYKKDRA